MVVEVYLGFTLPKSTILQIVIVVLNCCQNIENRKSTFQLNSFEALNSDLYFSKTTQILSELKKS